MLYTKKDSYLWKDQVTICQKLITFSFTQNGNTDFLARSILHISRNVKSVVPYILNIKN